MHALWQYKGRLPKLVALIKTMLACVGGQMHGSKRAQEQSGGNTITRCPRLHCHLCANRQVLPAQPACGRPQATAISSSAASGVAVLEAAGPHSNRSGHN